MPEPGAKLKRADGQIKITGIGKRRYTSDHIQASRSTCPTVIRSPPAFVAASR